MKIICIIIVFMIFLGCQKNPHFTMDEMNFVPYKSIIISNLTPFGKKFNCMGSYTVKKDTIITQFEIESKYSLIVIKLKNVSNNYTFNDHLSTYSTSGYFSTVNEGLYEVNLSPKVFNGNYPVNKIEFFSDSEVSYHINNDTVKSFSVNFNEYAIKLNNDDTKMIYSKIEYYGLKRVSANILFYNVEGNTYVFIMTPIKKNVILEKNILYDYLFG